MKKHLTLLCLLLLLFTLPHANAQDEAQVESLVRDYYAFLLSANVEDFGRLPEFLCDDYVMRPEVFEEIVTARGDSSFSLSDVSFTAEAILPVTEYIVTIAGNPSGASGAVVLPEEVRVVQQKVCPRTDHIRVIRENDLRLRQEDAIITVTNFYVAFYTGNFEMIERLSCVEKREYNLEGARRNYNDVYQFLPSDWDLTLNEDGFDYTVRSIGDLQLQLYDRTFIVNDRADFPNARLVRQDGWKFCGGYQEGQYVASEYARYYFGDFPIGDVTRRSCDTYAQQLGEASQVWTVQAQSINIPEGIFPDAYDYDLDTAQLSNLRALVLLTDDDAVSVGAEFGASVEVRREGNQWKWCQLPQDMLEE